MSQHATTIAQRILERALTMGDLKLASDAAILFSRLVNDGSPIIKSTLTLDQQREAIARVKAGETISAVARGLSVRRGVVARLISRK